MNAVGLIEHVELELFGHNNSMHSHASSRKEALKEFSTYNSSDFDQSKDQGLDKGESFPETLVTPRAFQSNQSPGVAEETDDPCSLFDPPLHLRLLEACVGSFTMQNVRPYQEVCDKYGLLKPPMSNFLNLFLSRRIEQRSWSWGTPFT